MDEAAIAKASEQWTEREILVDIAVSLSEIRVLLERLLSTERTGAVSSVSIKTAANKRDHGAALDLEVKSYSGSVAPVDEALEAYERMVREANVRSMRQWQEALNDR